MRILSIPGESQRILENLRESSKESTKILHKIMKIPKKSLKNP